MPELTSVEFQFYHPDGLPLADTTFSITLKRSGFITEAVGVVVPDVITATTDDTGKVVIQLHPSSTPYYLQLPSDVAIEEDCCSGFLARYKFYVPEVAQGVIVRAQDLFLAVSPSNTSYDEAAILIITEAKLTSVNAAREALASAVRAETAATTIEGDAERAEAARDAAEASKNAAGVYAQNAADNNTWAGQSAAAANASKNAAAGSATAASQSATASSQSATASAQSAAASLASQNAAKTSETNSKTSETSSKTNADNAAASAAAALASKNAAGLSETNASTSAGNALTQANRAQTEADRATAATDSKQNKSDNLTAFSGLVGAADRLPYFTGVGALSLSVLTSKARDLLARTNTTGMQTELGLVPVSSTTDLTSGRLVTPGWMGLGGVSLPINNGDFNTFGNSTKFVVANNCANGPITGSLYVIHMVATSDQYIYQHATDVTTARSWERQLLAGVWQPWLELAKIGLGLVKVASTTDNSNGSLATVGWGGLGGQLQSRPYTPDQMFTTQAGGSFSYANNGGAYPAGVTDGALINMGYDTAGQFAYQLLGDWRTGSLYRRGRATGTSGAWGRIYDSLNSVADPISQGGLMSSALIGGYLVNRYANGEVNIRGSAPTTVSLAANEIKTVLVSLPITLVSGALGTAFKSTTNAQPSNTYDFYGVVAEYLSDLSTIAFVIRNGPTAQTFQPTINVWGRWK